MAIVSIGTQTTTGLMLGLTPYNLSKVVYGGIQSQSAEPRPLVGTAVGKIIYGGIQSQSGVASIYPGTRVLENTIPNHATDPQKQIITEVYGVKYENVTTPLVYQFWS
jgi:hypothetical protein